MVGDVVPSLACVSCQSLFGSLGGMFQAERERSFEPLFFSKEPLEVFFRVLDSSVNDKAMLSDGCSLEDTFSEFRGEAGYSSRMEGSDHDHLYFFKKTYKQRTVMEFCITPVRCNQICI